MKPEQRQSLIRSLQGGASRAAAAAAESMTLAELETAIDGDADLAREVEVAEGKARALAEVSLLKDSPSQWLTKGPGAARPHRRRGPAPILIEGGQCTAKAKNSGKRCRSRAAPGLDKCKIHCGLSKAERERRAAQASATRRVRDALDALDRKPPPDADPLEVMLRVIAEEAREEQLLASAVDDLEMGDGGLYGPNHTGDGTPHVLKQMLDQCRDRLARHCKMALDAGVEERRVQIAEEQGQQLAHVLVLIVDDPSLELSDVQRRQLKQVGARHLRAVPG